MSVELQQKDFLHRCTHKAFLSMISLMSNKGEVVPKEFSTFGASLVAQWLKIHLPMQGTRVRALFQEDATCRGATKPVHHNYWAWVPQLLKPAHLEPVLRNKRSHRNEKPMHRNKE